MKRYHVALLFLLPILSWIHVATAADARCPVPKPASIPAKLTQTFSTDAAITFDAKLAELDDVLAGKKSDAVLEALRWLAHQPSTEMKLRDAVVNTLLPFYEVPWVADDLIGMMNDPAQPMDWRARCVYWLARLHERRNDDESWKGIETACASTERPIRNLALEEIARPVQVQRWARNSPELFARILNLVKQGLNDPDGSTVAGALRGVAAGELREMTPEAERIAGDAKQSDEVRSLALQALALIARSESLPVIEQIPLDPAKPKFTEAREGARAASLVARLDSPDAKVMADAYQALAAMGEAAIPALRRVVTMDRGNDAEEKVTKGRELAKTLWGNQYLAQFTMPPVNRAGMKVFLENKEKNRPGVKGMWIDLGTRMIVVQGESLLESGPLEYAAVLKNGSKGHESVVQLDASSGNVCLAILACAYIYTGELVQGNGKDNLQVPAGGAALMSVEYEREETTPTGTTKKLVRVPLNTLIFNNDTGKPMRKSPWVLNGSTRRQGGGLQFDVDKSLAALRSDPDALMNIVLDTAEQANFKRDGGPVFYEVNRALIPKKNTPCYLVIEPFTQDVLKPEDIHDQSGAPKAGAPKTEKKPKTVEGGPVAE